MESKHCPQSTRTAGHEKRPRRRHSGSLSIARWARKDQADLKPATSPLYGDHSVRVIEPVD